MYWRPAYGYRASGSDNTQVYALSPCWPGDSIALAVFEPKVGTAWYGTTHSLDRGFVWVNSEFVGQHPDWLEQAGASSQLGFCLRCVVGDPVNTMSGALVESFTDVALAGRGPGVVWSRSYASVNAAVDGPLGFGWSLEYAARLVVTGTGT